MKERPPRRDATALALVARRLHEHITGWEGYKRTVEQVIELSDHEHADEIIEGMILLVIKEDDTESGDGYALARQLEEIGWQPDAQLVALLDHAREVERDVWIERLRTWAEENDVKIELDEGARVAVTINSFKRQTIVKGTIVGSDPPLFAYEIALDSNPQEHLWAWIERTRLEQPSNPPIA